jgi:hypothetical protein
MTFDHPVEPGITHPLNVFRRSRQAIFHGGN